MLSQHVTLTPGASDAIAVQASAWASAQHPARRPLRRCRRTTSPGAAAAAAACGAAPCRGELRKQSPAKHAVLSVGCVSLFSCAVSNEPASANAGVPTACRLAREVFASDCHASWPNPPCRLVMVASCLCSSPQRMALQAAAAAGAAATPWGSGDAGPAAAAAPLAAECANGVAAGGSALADRKQDAACKAAGGGVNCAGRQQAPGVEAAAAKTPPGAARPDGKQGAPPRSNAAPPPATGTIGHLICFLSHMMPACIA